MYSLGDIIETRSQSFSTKVFESEVQACLRFGTKLLPPSRKSSSSLHLRNSVNATVEACLEIFLHGRLKWEYEGLLTDGNACVQIPWEGPWEGAAWLMVERIRFDEQ